MRKKLRFLGIFALIAVIGFSMAACKNLTNGDPDLTGMVSISGTAQVGQTLTANTANLGGTGTITYQWKRGTAKIGTNSNTYQLTDADLGSTITITVTCKGYSGSVTSQPTAVVTNRTPVASDYIIGNLTQTAGSVTAVTITPKKDKSPGKVTIYYNGSTTLPSAVGTYTVTFSVAAATGWNAASALAGGTLRINADNQYPVASDFNITNLTQTFGSVTAVTITPKTGKSTGIVTVYYNGLTTLPTAAGTYTVTFNVAAAAGWNAAIGLAGGTLMINAKVNAQTPSITSQPAGGTVIFGGTHNLSVTANVSDSGTLSYRWYSNTSASNNGGTPIPNATFTTYNPPTGTAGTYYYFVEITNTITNNGDGGAKTASVRSNAVTLTVNAKVNAQTPNITTQPASATVTVNASHSLSVTANASDGGTLSYRWYSNTSASNSGGTVISGAASATYNPPTGTAGTYYYFVEVTNTIPNNGDGGTKTATVKSNAVTVTVNPRVNAQTPNITSQPASAAVTVNALHSLSVTASVTDGGLLSYRWYSNTSASNSGGTIITGATSAAYNPPTGTTGTYYYFAEVTNTIPNNGDGGTKTASVRSNAAEMSIASPSSGIIIDLAGMNEWDLMELTAQAAPNTNKTFTVTGTYSSYQWYLDGVSVGTSSSYTFNRPAGVYQLVVVVTNNSGDSRSGRCWITVGN